MHPLSRVPNPFIVGVIVEDAPSQVVPAVEGVAREGCDAAEINLTALPTVGTIPWSREALTTLPIPIYTSARRCEFMTAYGLAVDDLPIVDDTARMAWQTEALGRGSVAIDMELDTFAPDPSPAPGTAAAAALAATCDRARELTHDPGAVASQRALIAEVHARGGEVIASCHTGTRQSAEDLIGIVAVATERGADRVKVVAPCPTIDDLLELFRATARLYEVTPTPFTLVGTDACGSLSRFVGPHLGSGWVFARPSEGRWVFADQPTASELELVLSAIRWRYAEVER